MRAVSVLFPFISRNLIPPGKSVTKLSRRLSIDPFSGSLGEQGQLFWLSATNISPPLTPKRLAYMCTPSVRVRNFIVLQ